MKEPIAIIGMGCRFPGGANSVDAFWQLLRDGVDAITEIPSERFDVDAYYDPTPAMPGKLISREGGFLDRIDQFDADFFGISAHEAPHIDPQQRLLLETTWQAMEDAGLNPVKLEGSRTGVFVGMWTNEYEDQMFAASNNIDIFIATGGGRYSASGRLSYVFDFRGPSMTLDTACSSSSVAIHLACRSIWNGEADMAVAGGVNLLLEPQISIGYSRSGMLAPDARCKFGDIRANGYVRSEGVGIILLKPLSQAVADGDTIHALIRGSAVSNDGRTVGGLGSPSSDGQAAMLRDAYQDAGVSPGQVGYIEAHGTGTRVGDPVELTALGRVLAEGRAANQPCLVGSVKTNIGHVEAASGIAGLIKTVMCLKNRAIPGNPQFVTPNPNIPWDEIPLVMQKTFGEWPSGYDQAFAGVSSFGVTGTTAHIVLQEAPLQPQKVQVENNGAVLMPISAHSPEALVEAAHNYQEWAASTSTPLTDAAYTAGKRRMHHAYRLPVVAASQAELAEKIGTWLKNPVVIQSDVEQPKVAFVFSGQGSYWWSMGRELLLQDPIFRDVIQECDTLIRKYANWSLIDELSASEENARLDQTAIAQPAMFAIQVALLNHWRSLGIIPSAVVGHSLGEVAAAYAAGVLSLEDAVRIVINRGDVTQRASGLGRMAVVAMSADEAEQVLAPYKDRVWVTAINSPSTIVLSGEPTALAEVVAIFTQNGVWNRDLGVEYPSHSPLMEPFQHELTHLVDGITAHPAQMTLLSTVTGAVIDGESMDTTYWGQNIRYPVQFAQSIKALSEQGFGIFVEIGPHPALGLSIEQCLGKEPLVLASMRREHNIHDMFLEGLGALYQRGVALDWDALYPAGGNNVSLPPYPFQRQRFWIEALPADGSNTRQVIEHPLLGYRLPQVAHRTGETIWENRLNTRFRTYFQQHGEEETLLNMGLAAAHLAYGDQLHVVNGLEIYKPLSPVNNLLLQCVLTHENDTSATFQIFSHEEGADWKHHATGKIAISTVSSDWIYEIQWEPSPIRKTGAEATTDPGSWLIFADGQGIGEGLAARLEAQGEHCILVRPDPADNVQDLFATFQADTLSARGIVNLWGLNTPETAAEFEAAQRISLGSILDTIKALTSGEWRERPRLWLVSQNTQAVVEGDAISPSGGSLWGFGRVISREHPEFWGGLIDLDAVDPVEHLFEALMSPDVDEIAFRSGQRYVPHLGHAQPPAQAFQWRDDGTYLITGGLGGIGLQMAKMLVEQGVRHLALIGRTTIPSREQWAEIAPDSSLAAKINGVRELEALGAQVYLASVDVTDESALKAFISDFRQSGKPPICGVLHTATVLADRLLLQMDNEALLQAIRPKVIGTWLLHQLLSEVDLFLLFSSVGAIVGQPGQGNYAAANAFLDAFAHYRRANGQPAMSINWTIWAGVGVANSSGREVVTHNLANQGIGRLKIEEGLAALDALMHRNTSHAAVLPADWSKFSADQRVPTLLTKLVAQNDAMTAPIKTEVVRDKLQTAAPEQRLEMLKSYLSEEVAKVIRRNVSEINVAKPLGEMGLDSLMGLELRNRLEGGLRLTLPATLVWNYPTLNEMMPYLVDKMGLPFNIETKAVETVASAANSNNNFDDIIADIQSLSDEDILKAFLGNK